MIGNMEEKDQGQPDVEDVNPLTGVPEGVDTSDPIEIPEEAQAISDISMVRTEEDLINLTVQRILDLDENDPVYDEILEGLASKARLGWYEKGDFEVFKIYIRKYPLQVFKHFDDLRELRIEIKRNKMKKARRRRSKR